MTLDPQVIASAFEETAHRKDFEIRERSTFEDRHVASLMLALRADQAGQYHVQQKRGHTQKDGRDHACPVSQLPQLV